MINRSITLLLFGLLCCIGIHSHGDTKGKPLKVRSVYPDGQEVSIYHRITVEFNQKVVGLGASMFIENDVPIDVEPALDCEWNWVKLDTLSCELPGDTNLDPSTRYEVTIRPEFKTLSGQTMESEFVHAFETIRPTMRSANLVSWRTPTRPIIEVEFNQEIDINSLKGRLFMYDSVSKKEVPTVAWLVNWNSRYALRQNYFGVQDRIGPRYFGGGGSQFPPDVVVRPQDSLSPGAKITLILLPGVEGATGNLKSIERYEVDTDITTFNEFRLLGLSCKDVSGKDIFLKVDEPDENACHVRSPIQLVFSSQFDRETINNFVHVQTLPNGPSWSTALDATWARGSGEFVYLVSGNFRSSSKYRLFVDQNATISETSQQKNPIQDGFGRRLVGKNEIIFRTGPASPRARLNETNVVVDSRGTVDPQITLGNIDDVSISYDVLDEVGIRQNQSQEKESPEQDDVFQAQFLGLRDILRTPSGVVIGNIDGQPRFNHPEERKKDYFIAQATPYSVFLKLGTVTSLAWVVDIQNGEPIADANVEFYLGNTSDLSEVQTLIHSDVSDQNGFVSLPGYEAFDPEWKQGISDINSACPDDSHCAVYFVRINGDAGMSLLPLDLDYVLDGRNSVRSIYQNIDHWATTSQRLYSPGDTVEIKGYVRSVRNEVRVIPNTGHYALCVQGPDDREYEIAPISLNEFGAYNASVRLNNRTELGDYELYLVYHPSEPMSEPCSLLFESPNYYITLGGSFQVFEFKTNPIRVTQELNAKSFDRGDRMTIKSAAELHAGGPYAHASGQLEIHLVHMDPPFESVDTNQFEFQSVDTHIQSFGREFWEDIELDDEGIHVYTIDSLNNDVYYGEYWSATSVISDRGKSVAARTVTPYYGVDQFVGIKENNEDPYRFDFENWIRVDEPWQIQVMVVSKVDEIVVGKDVQVTVYESNINPNQLERISLYSSGVKWTEIFSCKLVSDTKPVSCDFTPTEKNFYRIDAEIVDTKGNTHRTSIGVKARVDKRPPIKLVQPEEEIQLELTCDSLDVKVGDTVRCTVENLLSSSPALVSIERSSVIDKWLVRLDPTNPVIEFTVLEDYAPHFDLSVLNVAHSNATRSSDDPLYRIANKEFKMNNPQLEALPITVATDHDSYAPRDQVELSISTGKREDQAVAVEYAIAVVDESLLDLSGADDSYFDPTEKVWKVGAGGLRTYGLVALLMEESDVLPVLPTQYWDRSRSFDDDDEEVIASAAYMAREHLKTNDQTTDPNVRKLDRFIAYWNPSVVSSNGQATITFDLPDNLTSWKVLVMAVSSEDQFGFATTKFGTIKDTEVRVVAPNVVTEGDKFHVGASILNRAENRRTLTIEFQTSGLLDEKSEKSYQQELDFQPFERKMVSWEVHAGIRDHDFQEVLSNSEIRVIASVGDRQDQDALDIRIPVRPRHVRVSSVVYGAVADDTTTIPIEVPAKLAEENGQLDLTLTTNEEVNFDGVFRYAIEYPYTCWEQNLTQAVIAMQYLELEDRGVEHGIEWPDPDSLIVQVLDSAMNFQAPNGGMAYFVPTNRHSDAYLSAYTVIAFSWLENAGYEIPQDVNRKLLDYLQIHLANQEPKISNITATTNAVVLHALALSGELTEADLVQFTDHLHQMKLFGLAQFLLASISIDADEQLMGEIFDRIMNHRSLVDGAVEFIESVPLTYSQMLHSDTRSLCSILDALTSYSMSTANGLEIGELKELSNSVRYARDNAPRWLNTQDNVYCTHALITFSDYIEPNIQDMIATVNLRSSETGSSIRLANAWQFNTDITRLQTLHPMQAKAFGSKGALEINREGNGTAFYSVELAYLTTIDEKINRFSGFEVHREYFALRGLDEWELLEPGSYVKKGDYIFVNVFVNNRFSRHHVVIDDSVPGGLEPVNRNLATEYSSYFDRSELEEILKTSKWYRNFTDERGRWSHLQRFHGELGLQNVRYYSTFLRRGKHHLSWLGQAISAGEFTVLPTHVEEMYRPIMFGKSEPWTLKVKTDSP